MNIKTFTIIAIASFAVLSVTACGGKQKASIETEQTEDCLLYTSDAADEL